MVPVPTSQTLTMTRLEGGGRSGEEIKINRSIRTRKIYLRNKGVKNHREGCWSKKAESSILISRRRKKTASVRALSQIPLRMRMMTRLDIWLANTVLLQNALEKKEPCLAAHSEDGKLQESSELQEALVKVRCKYQSQLSCSYCLYYLQYMQYQYFQ